jgi:hypothetical protein
MTAREIIKTFMYAADYMGMGVNLKDIDTGEIHMMGFIDRLRQSLLADDTHFTDHYQFIRFDTFDTIRTANVLYVTLLVKKIND